MYVWEPNISMYSAYFYHTTKCELKSQLKAAAQQIWPLAGKWVAFLQAKFIQDHFRNSWWTPFWPLFNPEIASETEVSPQHVFSGMKVSGFRPEAHQPSTQPLPTLESAPILHSDNSVLFFPLSSLNLGSLIERKDLTWAVSTVEPVLLEEMLQPNFSTTKILTTIPCLYHLFISFDFTYFASFTHHVPDRSLSLSWRSCLMFSTCLVMLIYIFSSFLVFLPR